MRLGDSSDKRSLRCGGVLTRGPGGQGGRLGGVRGEPNLVLLGFQPQRGYGGAHPGVAGSHRVFIDRHGVFVHWVGRGAGGVVAPVHRAGAVQGRRDGGDAGHDAGAVH